MSILGVRQKRRRMSGRRLSATGVMMLTLASVFGVIGPVLPALATRPTIEAEVVCRDDGSVTINWTSRSWKQDPNDDAASSNPEIVIRFNGVKVATGAYTMENGYEFSGSNRWPDLSVSSVLVLAYAVAPFGNGEGQGSSQGRTIFLPEDCPATNTTTTSTTTTGSTTTTTEGTTTTTAGVTTTTAAATTTTAGVTTTTAQATTTTAGTDVLGIQVSAPQPAQVAQVTLPFTGVSTGSMALLAATFAGLGLLFLVAARQSKEQTPARSWR